jgi:S-adenosylmethionine decarboxylase
VWSAAAWRRFGSSDHQKIFAGNYKAAPGRRTPHAPRFCVTCFLSMNVGVEWIIDAEGCAAEALRDARLLRELCELILTDLELRVVHEPLWHCFPEPGGVTGLYLLTESHLACHTYPEHGIATFNLYCCRPRREWPWAERLKETLSAQRVTVRTVQRGGEQKMSDKGASLSLTF